MRKFIFAILIGLLCVGIYAAVVRETPAVAASTITARANTVNGEQVGEVISNGDVIMRIRTSAGGYTPYERAQTVATRLNNLMAANVKPQNITTGRRNGQEVVLANNEIIATADNAHARLNNTTPMMLANTWASRIENVVAGRAVTETPTSQKVVPILSVGRGTRIGGALVTGATSQLDKVKAVAQVDGQFGNSVRVRVLVPVSTTNVVQNISRVPETSVIGLVDIGL